MYTVEVGKEELDCLRKNFPGRNQEYLRILIQSDDTAIDTLARIATEELSVRMETLRRLRRRLSEDDEEFFAILRSVAAAGREWNDGGAFTGKLVRKSALSELEALTLWSAGRRSQQSAKLCIAGTNDGELLTKIVSAFPALLSVVIDRMTAVKLSDDELVSAARAYPYLIESVLIILAGRQKLSSAGVQFVAQRRPDQLHFTQVDLDSLTIEALVALAGSQQEKLSNDVADALIRSLTFGYQPRKTMSASVYLAIAAKFPAHLQAIADMSYYEAESAKVVARSIFDSSEKLDDKACFGAALHLATFADSDTELWKKLILKYPALLQHVHIDAISTVVPVLGTLLAENQSQRERLWSGIANYSSSRLIEVYLEFAGEIDSVGGAARAVISKVGAMMSFGSLMSLAIETEAGWRKDLVIQEIRGLAAKAKKVPPKVTKFLTTAR